MRTGSFESITLGHWLGLPVRLHISFALLALFVVFLTTRSPLAGMAAHGMLCLLVWFASVVLHEAGHCVAVARLGGATDYVMLTPLGGLSHHRYLRDPQHEFMAALSGPFANFCAWVACGCLLYALGGVSLWGLLNPLHPQQLFEGHALVIALRIGFWINWTLVLVNLLPLMPLDGGWAVYSLMWPPLGHRKAQAILRRLTIFGALALCGLAVWMGGQTMDRPVPAWLPLGVLGVCVACYAFVPLELRDEETDDDELFGYDFSQGYTSLEEDEPRPRQREPGPIRRWLQRRRQAREAELRRIEVEEERQVDAILTRLHQYGIDALSPRERALLDRVSARYRARLRQ